ncbi:type II toxin-antitoxin system prevent-host-death family antitoxin [cf. Phormidesmis sp. LEGE 11477]|uniref:type II toxin-antitoxin system prevent-host-death family antitoxin n=1 Tax=cf. Phormidesmis sp. LEGE 11477 TaxID=1828680 RepID=UPI0018821CAB|nr:type II toxin-antitoxin system prevent-host-death family antitoxin [cf. Phormidesmis sp. LEGE 11477]MBE9063290.1 type II toxin-antitoxin system prevent-host-death family antitoxin [cf. Phormidesmis sp. LEGE 11477]
MVSLQNIQSLTDFRHSAKKYVEQLQTTQAPLVLTVNGKAVVVVEAAEAYEAYQARIRELEAEVMALKLQTLKDAVAIGAQQAEQGQFSDRSFDEIIAAAQSAVSSQSAS